ncbi:hypothetical protein [Deinococcus misasensis]|uniref:hypothetical protein n=1 Tax=Deinococcus misasensis TaxID=392413 RepID=UPI000551CDF3|nr:hypothetical protein [Deinococcus misasensis]
MKEPHRMVDVYVSIELTLAAVLPMVCRFFAVAPDEVLLFSHFEERPESDWLKVKVWGFVRSTDGGDFLSSVHLFTQVDQQVDEAEFARHLARELNCACLITDDDVNPYTMLYIDASQRYRVALDVKRLDDHEMVIARKMES